MTSFLGKRVSRPSARARAAQEQEDDESEDDAQHARVELVLPPEDSDSSDDENEHPLEQQVDALDEEDVAPVVQKNGETKVAAAKRAKDEENARWSPNLVAFGAPAFKGPKVGPTAPRKQRDTALKCWKLFFTETLLTAICAFTNEYGQSKFEEKPLGTTELSVFLGCLILLGIYKAPTIQDIFKGTFAQYRVAEVFPRDRFVDIMSSLHFSKPNLDRRGKTKQNEDKEQRKDDKLFKIRPFIDSMRDSFHSTFNPSENLALDEQMCASTHHLSFQQFQVCVR